MNRFGKLLVGAALVAVAATAAASAGPMPVIDCTGGPCTGTAASEWMNGTDGPDQIRALGGNDSIFADGADDVLRGGQGDDFGGGGLGDDKSVGGPGADDFLEFSKVGGDQGNDLQKGGKGNDRLGAGIGRDKVLGGRGNDRVEFQPPEPPRNLARGLTGCFRGFCAALRGEEGADLVKGGKGKDYLEGGAASDTLVGGDAADVIDAANNDTPGSKDIVRCGDGRDVVFANGRDEVADDCEKVKPPQPPQE
jgi:Ca2+-binding RTX toxin-like protein